MNIQGIMGLVVVQNGQLVIVPMAQPQPVVVEPVKMEEPKPLPQPKEEWVPRNTRSVKSKRFSCVPLEYCESTAQYPTKHGMVDVAIYRSGVTNGKRWVMLMWIKESSVDGSLWAMHREGFFFGDVKKLVDEKKLV